MTLSKTTRQFTLSGFTRASKSELKWSEASAHKSSDSLKDSTVKALGNDDRKSSQHL